MDRSSGSAAYARATIARQKKSPAERAGLSLSSRVETLPARGAVWKRRPGSPGSSAGRLVVILVVILVVKRHDVDAELAVRLQKPLQLRVAYPSLVEIMLFLHQGRQLVRR